MRFLSSVLHPAFWVSVIIVHGQNAPYFYVGQHIRPGGGLGAIDLPAKKWYQDTAAVVA